MEKKVSPFLFCIGSSNNQNLSENVKLYATNDFHIL